MSGLVMGGNSVLNVRREEEARGAVNIHEY